MALDDEKDKKSGGVQAGVIDTMSNVFETMAGMGGSAGLAGKAFDTFSKGLGALESRFSRLSDVMDDFYNRMNRMSKGGSSGAVSEVSGEAGAAKGFLLQPGMESEQIRILKTMAEKQGSTVTSGGRSLPFGETEMSRMSGYHIDDIRNLRSRAERGMTGYSDFQDSFKYLKGFTDLPKRVMDTLGQTVTLGTVKPSVPSGKPTENIGNSAIYEMLEKVSARAGAERAAVTTATTGRGGTGGGGAAGGGGGGGGIPPEEPLPRGGYTPQGGQQGGGGFGGRGQMGLGKFMEFASPFSPMSLAWMSMFAMSGQLFPAAQMMAEPAMQGGEWVKQGVRAPMEFGASFTGLPALGKLFNKVATTDAFELYENMYSSFTVLKNVYKSQEKAAGTIESSIQLARETPLEVNDLLKIFSTFSVNPQLRGVLSNKGQMGQLAGGVAGLSFLVPEQGTQGAIFAIREALAGQFRSMRNRFNIDPQLIASAGGMSMEEMKAKPANFLGALDTFLKQNLGQQTFNELQMTFTKQVGNIYDSLTGGIFKAFQQTGMYENVTKYAGEWSNVTQKFFGSDTFGTFFRDFGTKVSSQFAKATSELGSIDFELDSPEKVTEKLNKSITAITKDLVYNIAPNMDQVVNVVGPLAKSVGSMITTSLGKGMADVVGGAVGVGVQSIVTTLEMPLAGIAKKILPAQSFAKMEGAQNDFISEHPLATMVAGGFLSRGLINSVKGIESNYGGFGNFLSSKWQGVGATGMTAPAAGGGGWLAGLANMLGIGGKGSAWRGAIGLASGAAALMGGYDIYQHWNEPMPNANEQEEVKRGRFQRGETKLSDYYMDTWRSTNMGSPYKMEGQGILGNIMNFMPLGLAAFGSMRGGLDKAGGADLWRARFSSIYGALGLGSTSIQPSLRGGATSEFAHQQNLYYPKGWRERVQPKEYFSENELFSGPTERAYSAAGTNAPSSPIRLARSGLATGMKWGAGLGAAGVAAGSALLDYMLSDKELTEKQMRGMKLGTDIGGTMMGIGGTMAMIPGLGLAGLGVAAAGGAIQLGTKVGYGIFGGDPEFKKQQDKRMGEANKQVNDTLNTVIKGRFDSISSLGDLANLEDVMGQSQSTNLNTMISDKVSKGKITSATGGELKKELNDLAKRTILNRVQETGENFKDWILQNTSISPEALEGLDEVAAREMYTAAKASYVQGAYPRAPMEMKAAGARLVNQYASKDELTKNIANTPLDFNRNEIQGWFGQTSSNFSRVKDNLTSVIALNAQHGMGLSKKDAEAYAAQRAEQIGFDKVDRAITMIQPYSMPREQLLKDKVYGFQMQAEQIFNPNQMQTMGQTHQAYGGLLQDTYGKSILTNTKVPASAQLMNDLYKSELATAGVGGNVGSEAFKAISDKLTKRETEGVNVGAYAIDQLVQQMPNGVTSEISGATLHKRFEGFMQSFKASVQSYEDIDKTLNSQKEGLSKLNINVGELTGGETSKKVEQAIGDGITVFSKQITESQKGAYETAVTAGMDGQTLGNATATQNMIEKNQQKIGRMISGSKDFETLKSKLTQEFGENTVQSMDVEQFRKPMEALGGLNRIKGMNTSLGEIKNLTAPEEFWNTMRTGLSMEKGVTASETMKATMQALNQEVNVGMGRVQESMGGSAALASGAWGNGAVQPYRWINGQYMPTSYSIGGQQMPNMWLDMELEKQRQATTLNPEQIGRLKEEASPIAQQSRDVYGGLLAKARESADKYGEPSSILMGQIDKVRQSMAQLDVIPTKEQLTEEQSLKLSQVKGSLASYGKYAFSDLMSGGADFANEYAQKYGYQAEWKEGTSPMAEAGGLSGVAGQFESLGTAASNAAKVFDELTPKLGEFLKTLSGGIPDGKAQVEPVAAGTK